MIKSPLFILFEGIDGSGKSTQSNLLFRYFESIGLPAVKLFEPTDGEWGRKIREMLRGEDMPPADELLNLFIKDREEDAEKNILPALNGKKIIIMDRYYYSNAAYQGAAGISPEKIIAKNREKDFPEPDRVYFIDIPPAIAVMRVTNRSEAEKDVFEKESFLEKVRDIYLELADDKFLVINGTGDIEEIFKIIINDIESNFS